MKHFFTLSFLLLAASIIYAQDAQIKGTITDVETKEPLGGATVKVDRKFHSSFARRRTRHCGIVYRI
jgi:hypothetical protein